MDSRNARYARDADGKDDTLIDLESALRDRINKLVDKAHMHEQMSMNATTLPYRVNHRREADLLNDRIAKLRRQLRGIRRGPSIHRDIFSIEPFTK